jgi:hypothetical protein
MTNTIEIRQETKADGTSVCNLIADADTSVKNILFMLEACREQLWTALHKTAQKQGYTEFDKNFFEKLQFRDLSK